MSERQVTVLDGSTFMVSDPAGDVDAHPDEPAGLFARDMRHLSRWRLRLGGRPLRGLTGTPADPGEAVFVLVAPTGARFRDPTTAVLRTRRVGADLRETLRLDNHGREPVRADLTVEFAADFADLFEVKDRLAKAGTLDARVEPGRVVLSYLRGDLRWETVIEAPGAELTGSALTYRLDVPPGGSWTAELTVSTGDGARPRPAPPARAPRLRTDWPALHRIYERSLADLAALRLTVDGIDGAVPAAGLPWFMALFGRDSLLTGYQALPFAPDLARTTLRALAAHQATGYDDFTDAEPGKILHELRHGELTRFGQRPHGPYYGAADSTPLFLVLLDEYARWTGDAQTVAELEPAARAALAWLDRHDGYVTYRARNPDTGLVNQCWKDSGDAIVHPDGTLAAGPIAVCEIQGYAYDARRRAARLARAHWGDPALADELDAAADALRDRFDRDFWLPGEGFHALALDGEGRPVPTLTSNVGHLLWSGIVPPGRAGRLAAHLTGERLFSGWGVRTLAAGQAAYNPVGYHVGTVWPHDTALAAAGLARYGYRAEAARIAVAVLEAAGHFDDRLPEVFTGHGRDETRVPAQYPTACSPQAWAAGTPLLLLRVLLGLEPGPDGPDRPVTDPYLAGPIGSLALELPQI